MAQSRRRKPRVEPARSSLPDRHRAERADWIVAAIAAVGVMVTAYLTAIAWSGTAPVLCSEGGGCDLIQRSQWSTLLALPVALWGLGLYGVLVLLSLVPMTRLRRWQRSWSIALLGVAISLYLTAAGAISLEAFCPWCLFSLALIATIFVLLTLRRPPSAPRWRGWLVNHGLFVGVLLLALHLHWSGMFQPRAEPRMTALAQHLDATGAKFYGAFWCPSCREQKKLFGGAADALPYVECSPAGRQGGMAFECVNAEIRDFPTWIIRGRRYEQIMQPDELATRSGFRWKPEGSGTDAEPAGTKPEN